MYSLPEQKSTRYSWKSKISFHVSFTANRLQKVWDFSQETIADIIDSLDTSIEATGIIEKLQASLQMLKDKSLETKEKAREELLELLNSEKLEKVLSKLPKYTQAAVRKYCEALKSALEKGLEIEEGKKCF